MKYHINSTTGEPGLCKAKIKCRFGDIETEHYDSKESARNAYELKFSKDTIPEPIKVFHGSPNKFDEFDYAKIGAQGTSEGQGFYFTDNNEVASNYSTGGYIYEVDFHGKKALSITSNTISKEDFRNILLEMHRAGSNYLSNWGDVEYDGLDEVLDIATDGSYDDGPGGNDVDNIGGLLNAAEGSAEKVYRTLYEKFGYDHIPAKTDWGNGQTVYVATVPEAFTIKNVKRV